MLLENDHKKYLAGGPKMQGEEKREETKDVQAKNCEKEMCSGSEALGSLVFVEVKFNQISSHYKW